MANFIKKTILMATFTIFSSLIRELQYDFKVPIKTWSAKAYYLKQLSTLQQREIARGYAKY